MNDMAKGILKAMELKAENERLSAENRDLKHTIATLMWLDERECDHLPAISQSYRCAKCGVFIGTADRPGETE